MVLLPLRQKGQRMHTYLGLPKIELVATGKTKDVFRAEDGRLILKNKNAITAFNDKTKTKIYEWKAVAATTVTANNFRLLKEAGIPVAFEGLNATDEFVTPNCKPIRLELIIRRVADPKGSYVRRHPELRAKMIPGMLLELDPLVLELNLKTTEGKIEGLGGETFGTLPEDVLKAGQIVDDPLCKVEGEVLHLWHPDLPSNDPRANLKIAVPFEKIATYKLADLLKLMRATFLVLEKGWAKRRCRLKDLKIEVGTNQDGKLLVIDVIDLDSWRMEDPTGLVEWSKQLFRDDREESEIKAAYLDAAKMSEHLEQPYDGLVFWRASPNDPLPIEQSELRSFPGVKVHFVELSAHKEPNDVLEAKLAELHGQHRRDNMMFIAEVGMLNGLAPYLYRNSPYPVVTYSPSIIYDAWKDDSVGALRTPTGIAPLVAGNGKNAIDAALRILSANNPALYAYCEMERSRMVTTKRKTA